MSAAAEVSGPKTNTQSHNLAIDDAVKFVRGELENRPEIVSGSVSTSSHVTNQLFWSVHVDYDRQKDGGNQPVHATLSRCSLNPPEFRRDYTYVVHREGAKQYDGASFDEALKAL